MNKQVLGLILVIIPLIFFVYLNFNSEQILIPAGYDLAIDGYIVSRSLVMIFTFYLLTKLGYFMLKETKKD